MSSFAFPTISLSVLTCCATALTVIIGRALIPKKYVNLGGKYVVITGCDSGFGALSAADIAKRTGALVIALCLTDAGCQAALASGAYRAIKCNFLNPEEIERAADEIKRICSGSLWAIVHNAGICYAGPIDFQPQENFRRTMEVNFFAMANLNQRLMPCIKATAGRVILITSVEGLVVTPLVTSYAASKFACEAFAQGLRAESCHWGINVCVINPSTMKTNIVAGFYESLRSSWNAMDKIDPTGLWKQEWSKEWLDFVITKGTKDVQDLAEDPVIVVRDIYDAVANVTPRIRYLSGAAAKTIYYFLWVCPESWTSAFTKSLISPKPTILSGPSFIAMRK